MVLKTFDVASVAPIRAQKLTPDVFAPFGGVLSADDQIKNVESSAANYGTAVKIHKVAPIINNYKDCPSGKEPTANWNIFRCSAPKHLLKNGTYTSKVLERHPFTTQTFVPMGQDLHKVSYVVIVAKTDYSTDQNLPDPNSLQAFVCQGNQSVTYGPGIWHAPMVVIDEATPHIDFAVFIHENGVADEDCQECYFEPGFTVGYGSQPNL